MILPAPAPPFTPSARYPDPSVVALQPEFLKYRVYSSSVEQLARSAPSGHQPTMPTAWRATCKAACWPASI